MRIASGAETLTAKIPVAKVVSAFGTLPSEVFFDVFDARDTAPRLSAVYCSDHDDANAVAATLLRDLGFDPVDAGRSESGIGDSALL